MYAIYLHIRVIIKHRMGQVLQVGGCLYDKSWVRRSSIKKYYGKYVSFCS